jgi:hypothetical protein
MPCRTRVLGFSVPPRVAEEYERIATRQGKTKSELFRVMLETYKSQLDEREFAHLQQRTTRNARRKRIFTEKDVERIVFQDR